ncbi:hypothetical protein MO973_04865 [Paenibacillus sp. TRM 82003]|nr:hypothetical protein [Paenibacillus sp. TRM 82003]
MRLGLLTLGLLISFVGVVVVIQYNIFIGMALIIVGTLFEISSFVLRRKRHSSRE